MSTVTQSAPRSVVSSLRILGWIAGVVAVLFSLLAIDHALALAGGRVELQARLIAWLTSDTFVFGEGNLREMEVWYRDALGRMSLHMVLGGIALGLGILQFVPSLRRRKPRLHRKLGLIIWLATLASMVGAISFLATFPMHEDASGAAFHLGLWALALLTLLLLAQAVLAAWSRDFRSHMVWMSTVMAALATAPMLRLDWVVFSHLWGGHQLAVVSLATGTFVLLQTLLLMTIWLTWIGDRDLPARPTPVSTFPMWLVRLLAVLSALGAVQEGLLAPLGHDLFASSRDARELLPPGASLWAIASVVAMISLPTAWRDALTGAVPSRLISFSSAAVALGALAIGVDHDRGSMERFSIAAFWVAYGMALLFALGLAHLVPPNSAGRNAWSHLLLASLWLPSQLNGLLLVGVAVGADFSEAMTAALFNGFGGIAVVGIATGFGARFRFWPSPGWRSQAAST